MPALLKVARLGHPVLRQKAEPIDPANIQLPELQEFIDSMIATMHDHGGVGLAAPQVHISKRLVVFHESAGLIGADGEPLVALINPEITPIGDDLAAMWEGCLSIPELRGRVTRPDRIRLTGLDREGREVDLDLDDFDAVVAQHECDHLDGILFVDRIEDTTKMAFETEFERYWQEETEEESDFIDAEG